MLAMALPGVSVAVFLDCLHVLNESWLYSSDACWKIPMNFAHLGVLDLWLQGTAQMAGWVGVMALAVGYQLASSAGVTSKRWLPEGTTPVQSRM